MTSLLWFVVAGVALVSVVVAGTVRALALKKGLIDVPNSRSSHAFPTPRGGGVAIVIGVGAGLIVLYACAELPVQWVSALAPGTVVATIGFLDDCRPVPPVTRFTVHACAAAWAMFALGGLPPIQIGGWLVQPNIAGSVLGVVAIVWTVNLFNFMDGIDGIATSEASFISAAGGAIVLVRGDSPVLATIALTFSAATVGFLFWNWPPAKIFLGDVGSGFLGFFTAVLALLSSQTDPAGPFIWLILGGAFFVDATVTLVRRIARREVFHQAHRTHAYQWLSRRWGAHRPVTQSVLAVNLFWLLPIALLAEWLPRLAIWLAIAALLPLVLLAVVSGAGRPENLNREGLG
jgi:Fuc2NAc and GlcNAc transferase